MKLPLRRSGRMTFEHSMLRTATLCLIAYGADTEAIWRRAAVYVDKILRGAKPADLPVEQSTPILVINLKTAAALGIQVPSTLSQLANEVIE